MELVCCLIFGRFDVREARHICDGFAAVLRDSLSLPDCELVDSWDFLSNGSFIHTLTHWIQKLMFVEGLDMLI
jgi:hypothetical protein